MKESTGTGKEEKSRESAREENAPRRLPPERHKSHSSPSFCEQSGRARQQLQDDEEDEEKTTTRCCSTPNPHPPTLPPPPPSPSPLPVASKWATWWIIDEETPENPRRSRVRESERARERDRPGGANLLWLAVVRRQQEEERRREGKIREERRGEARREEGERGRGEQEEGAGSLPWDFVVI
ncbi:hypothetical protein MARPO_0187s0005 [Marchantia polymorpha]|uniref:Uncharacterized protein n=1 Tax=Marchantia polymorpha TaxID=3197 RepID=A0A2R6W1G0_MARPO|nr:hypothetical protein MARPO_0187s0005 [Marchantia polymorpha]|eukprot:PTQ27681.1 hypothetical protein MARPO_0187s0005 [Marchantia polymorpha]